MGRVWGNDLTASFWGPPTRGPFLLKGPPPFFDPRTFHSEESGPGGSLPRAGTPGDLVRPAVNTRFVFFMPVVDFFALTCVMAGDPGQTAGTSQGKAGSRPTLPSGIEEVTESSQGNHGIDRVQNEGVNQGLGRAVHDPVIAVRRSRMGTAVRLGQDVVSELTRGGRAVARVKSGDNGIQLVQQCMS